MLLGRLNKLIVHRADLQLKLLTHTFCCATTLFHIAMQAALKT
jgi:hypothetical protein